jgi:two-component system probable response regulator PhcQ
MYRILLVDDEPNILSALRRCLSAIDVSQLDGEALKIETFTSPEAAIERGEEQEFDLVISDYRMPTMNGVEFLSHLMETQPNAPRVIISGYADREAIIAAINEANLTRFIEKPWNDQQLRASVVAILGNATKGSAKRGASLDPSIVADRQLKRLEEDSPGITQVERDEDGGIVIAPEDWED